MAIRRSRSTGQVQTKHGEPPIGARVTVRFGRRESTGTIVTKTVTGRYTVNVDIEGSDAPVTTTYAENEIQKL